MKTKNKHGRTGRKRHAARANRRAEGQVQFDVSSDAFRQGRDAGYEEGVRDGAALARAEEHTFMRELLTKRNAKDIKGLIDRRLG
jgi:hypothetical protein